MIPAHPTLTLPDGRRAKWLIPVIVASQPTQKTGRQILEGIQKNGPAQ
jgi:hypothetical protein